MRSNLARPILIGTGPGPAKTEKAFRKRAFTFVNAVFKNKRTMVSTNHDGLYWKNKLRVVFGLVCIESCRDFLTIH